MTPFPEIIAVRIIAVPLLPGNIHWWTVVLPCVLPPDSEGEVAVDWNAKTGQVEVYG